MAVTVAVTGKQAGPGELAPAAAPVLAYLAAAYAVVNFGLPGVAPSSLNLYLVQPAIWSGLAFLCLSQRPGLARLPGSWMVTLGLLAGAFQVAVYALAGFVYGFGYSTYAHGPATVMLNLVYLGSMLWGLECARAYLLAGWSARPGVAFVAVAALLATVALPAARWQAALSGGQAAFEASGSSLLPAASESCLATLLALAGGPWAAFAYRMTAAAAEWTSPVLPSLGWMLGALVGTLAPAAGFLALRSLMSPPRERGDTTAIPGWMLALGVMIVAVIWLNTGLLGVRPALISGVSMEPKLTLGDIVVTRQVDAATLSAGDIIRFRSGEVPVLHRIIEVKRGPEGLAFVTKGDNNNLADGLVAAASVEGKVVLVIPAVGIIPVKVKSWLAR